MFYEFHLIQFSYFQCLILTSSSYKSLTLYSSQIKTLTLLYPNFAGLTFPDSGTINVLGLELMPGHNYMTEQHMMGYCNRSHFLVDSLTVEEHFTLFTEVSLTFKSLLHSSIFICLPSMQRFNLNTVAAK